MRGRKSILMIVLVAGLGVMTLRAVEIANTQTGAKPASASDTPRLEHQTFTLPNGLEVILSEDQRLPMVAVNLWYHVGPANETPGRTGFAHLFEHMMFQGSKHVAADTHFKLLEAAGATDINGTTDFDRTNYFETVPSNQLELALWLESDRMGYLLDMRRSEGAREPAGRRAQRAAAERREPAVRHRRRGAVTTRSFRRRIRTTHRSSARTPTSRPRSSTTCSTSSSSTTRRTTPASRSSATSITAAARALVEKYFGAAQARPRRAEDHGNDAADHGREEAHGHRHRGAAARLHGVAHAADLQARRRRGGHRGGRFSAAASRAGCTRRSSTTSRSRSR